MHPQPARLPRRQEHSVAILSIACSLLKMIHKLTGTMAISYTTGVCFTESSLKRARLHAGLQTSHWRYPLGGDDGRGEESIWGGQFVDKFIRDLQPTTL